MPLPTQLSQLNTQLAAVGEISVEVVHDWMWGTDPEESYHVDVLLNRNHLLGLMVCRYKYLVTKEQGGPECYARNQRMTIMDKPVQHMTWRELKDTVANILLEWPAFLDRLRENARPKQNLRQVLHLVNLCAARFGYLAYLAADEALLDDVSETQPCRDREFADKITLTAGALRRMVGSLHIMYRHLHLLSMCSKVPPQHYQAGISKYHYEASNDAFHLLCMHISLPVAARLNYRHDFPGMYNHVSQVVYFHNSQYARIARHPLADIANAPPVHVLPAVQELFPEIPLRFEEDKIDPTKSQGWYWLMLAGRIYLVTPEPKVLHSERISDMLKVYIDANKAA
jgi:hypothetical protein